MREATTNPSALESSVDLKLSSDDDIIQVVEGYTEAGVTEVIT